MKYNTDIVRKLIARKQYVNRQYFFTDMQWKLTVTWSRCVLYRIVEAIQQYTENVELNTNRSNRLTISRPNVDVHIFDVLSQPSESVNITTSRQEMVYGMGLGRTAEREAGLADDDNVEFYRFPISVDDITARGVEGAILLSRDAIEMARKSLGMKVQTSYAQLPCSDSKKMKR